MFGLLRPAALTLVRHPAMRSAVAARPAATTRSFMVAPTKSFFAPTKQNTSLAPVRRTLSDAAPAAQQTLEEAYSTPLRYLHWLIAGGVLSTFGFVQAAQNTTGETKGTMMFYHKSAGLLVAGLVPLRLAVRLASKVPPHLPGHAVEVLAGKLSHVALYAFMIILPTTGVAMGYFGGKGLPFFFTTIPGAEKPNGDIAKNAFKVHKQAGQFFEYLVPIHMGAAFYHHLFKGHAIFARINPFAKAAK